MDLRFNSKLHILDHPLIKHKITTLRNKNTGTSEFSQIVAEVAMLETYEALRDLPIHDIVIETPLEKTKQPIIGPELVLVPLLRAGLGMVEGVRKLVPTAKVGHIGLFRDPETHLPHAYYAKLPTPLEERVILVLDPMLATGGSAVDAVQFIKEKGGKKIKFMGIVAAPEGLKYFCENHPDVQVYLGALDRELNKDKYILPGLGDAGDRIFGTK